MWHPVNPVVVWLPSKLRKLGHKSEGTIVVISNVYMYSVCHYFVSDSVRHKNVVLLYVHWINICFICNSLVDLYTAMEALVSAKRRRKVMDNFKKFLSIKVIKIVLDSMLFETLKWPQIAPFCISSKQITDCLDIRRGDYCCHK
jgi:hypothetical protein